METRKRICYENVKALRHCGRAFRGRADGDGDRATYGDSIDEVGKGSIAPDCACEEGAVAHDERKDKRRQGKVVCELQKVLPRERLARCTADCASHGTDAYLKPPSSVELDE